ncbi:zinc finger protein PLAGL2-like [Cololabis saira]|uniref:zinc finger protein PLAGL2-like n=1 Tax=Cololabis saira TaxID=129043 RepID=UPI002AD49308|nr:zinc finger protein PLAGL2-like [Cololabis saira]XP_061592915.1 zinc finger protein PLAGL2-like [Cololabis saira]
MFHQDPPSRQVYHCQDCGKQYNTQLGYRRHVVASHGASAGLESQALLESLVDHSDRPPPEGATTGVPVRERKYSCERCDRRFYTRKDVRRHAVVHTGRRDFLCPRCAQRFGRRDHLTRHLKKSHAQEVGLMSPPGTPGGAPAPPAQAPSPAAPDVPPVSKEPMEVFPRDMCPSYAMPGVGGPPQGLMQGSFPPQGPHHLQAPAAPQQQPFNSMSRYQHSTTSYPRADMDSFLLDLQSAPPPHSTTSPSPQREVLGDAVAPTGPELDLGPLLGFLPFSLPPYSPHVGMGGLVMSYPTTTSSSSSASTGPSQAPGPFPFFQPSQGPGPQGPPVHGQLPQAYSPAMSTSSPLPHYYQAFQQ